MEKTFDSITATPAVNSQAWWETYFAEHWEKNHGSAQTRHFMQCLTAHLDEAVTRFLRYQPRDLVDWGCAFGEGVAWLSHCFPYSRVTGVDYAARAIEEARRLHPQCEFLHAEDGMLPRPFDVVITSNCLEHFDAPLDKIKEQLPFCRWLYIALVPYNEAPLCDQHRVTLHHGSFPATLDSFTRLSTKVIDTDPAYWNGQQLLVVYGSPEYLAQRVAALPYADERETWDRYYADLPLRFADEAPQALHRELIELAAGLLPQANPEAIKTLEAGCGGGWHSLALAQAGYRTTLLDFAPNALDYARRLFACHAQSAQFQLGDALMTGEPEYDLVFNAGVLANYDLQEQATFLRAMASRSRKYVLVLVPNRACYWYWLSRIEQTAASKETPLTDLSEAFRSAGLRFLGQHYVGAAWAESFIKNLPGISLDVAHDLVNIHRSPLIPSAEKSYWLAALGTVEETPEPTPTPWAMADASHHHKIDELTGAMADALALSVKYENELRQKEQTLKTLTAHNRQLKQAVDKAEAALIVLPGFLRRINTGYWKARRFLGRMRNWSRRKARALPAALPLPGATLTDEQKYPQKYLALQNLSGDPLHRAQLARVIERVSPSPGAVIFPPTIGWNVALFQRPHHLARALAQRGYLAIFDCGDAPDDVNGFKEIEPNLFLFKGATNLLAAIPKLLLWTFTYNYAQHAHYPAGTPVLYDWIDDLEVFHHDQQFLAEQHAQALQQATLVTSVALRLHRQALSVRRDALYLPNGVEVARFADDQITLPDDPALNDWLHSDRPLAGYYGALAAWFDYDLLEAVAQQRTDWNFVLIGPNFDGSLLQHSVLTCPNVRWIGPRDYPTLPGYLKRFDVATIPFVINDITLATSPLKLYEYLAGGKPVITTPMPECMAFAEVQIVRNADEFAAALDEALTRRSDPTFRARLQTMAEQHSWQQRVTAATNALTKHFLR